MSMRRMMEGHYDSIMRRMLVLIAGFLLAITLFGGCHDPAAADFDAKHRRLSNIAKQGLQQDLSAFPLTSQVGAFYPAP